MNDTTKPVNPESVCTFCVHYYPKTGYCTRISSNVLKNPELFVERCDGKLFSKREASDISDGLMSNKFATLLTYGNLLSGIGWIVLSVGIIMFLSGIIALGNNDDVSVTIKLGVGIMLLGTGIANIVFGQLISCFVSIENNTRLTYESLKGYYNNPT